MKIENMLTDELVDLRELAKNDKNYKLSDEIRNELDSRNSFIFDTPNGTVVYHLIGDYNRDYVKKNLDLIDGMFN